VFNPFQKISDRTPITSLLGYAHKALKPEDFIQLLIHLIHFKRCKRVFPVTSINPSSVHETLPAIERQTDNHFVYN